MKLSRAQEIFSDSNSINVEYHQQPVWITKIDSENNKAEVELINHDRTLKIVEIEELKEF